MPTTRSYGDNCGIARALDVVGERWALLVVRELLLGPQRFVDLRASLKGASSNLLTDRLRELQAREVIARRKLAPPAGSWVYELTDWGRELEPVLLALGGWGLRVPRREGATLNATSMMIFLRGGGKSDPALPPTEYRVELDESVWTVRAEDGAMHVRRGEPAEPSAGIDTDPLTFNALFEDPDSLAERVSAGAVRTSGDPAALETLLRSVGA
ncbi:MAG TPA: helix-turn-helix domain-containing protein [Pseudonocardiaceae bacterium]|jgi:DNA-binding HxlR family transcriptional regulator|nr:helix-turn-helix domain-containing protein [Pseudonocardiaceae bacterium]